MRVEQNLSDASEPLLLGCSYGNWDRVVYESNSCVCIHKFVLCVYAHVHTVPDMTYSLPV